MINLLNSAPGARPGRPLWFAAALAGAQIALGSLGAAQAANPPDVDPVAEYMALARAKDPSERNLRISRCVIERMETEHGREAAELIVKATAAQSRGERVPPETVPAITVMIPIAANCTRQDAGLPPLEK